MTNDDQNANSTARMDATDKILLRYPSQCIRCVEAVVWCSKVSRALACENQSEMKALWFVLIAIPFISG